MNSRWFHGHISYEDTELILSPREEGTFLIRFSKSNPCSFVAALVFEGNVIQLIIKAHAPNFFKLYQPDESEDPTFQSLEEAISHFKQYLVTPLNSHQLWNGAFIGTSLTSEKITEILKGQPKGSYLIRYSTNSKGDYVVHMVTEKQGFSMIKVPYDASRSCFVLEGQKFANMSQLVSHFSDLLTTVPDLGALDPVLARQLNEAAKVHSYRANFLSHHLSMSQSPSSVSSVSIGSFS